MRTAWLIGVVVILTGAHVASTQAREPPASQCIDGRKLADARQIDARTLVLQDTAAGRRRVTLSDDCADVLRDDQVQFVGWGGWICGNDGDVVRSSVRTCRVEAVDLLDAQTYAGLLRNAQAPMLDTVVVQGRRTRGFSGTADYCVANRWLRSWHDGPDGLVVEVSPRRTAGHRHYRIETAGSCSFQFDADTLALVSAMGTGVVCGHPGDQVVFGRDSSGGDIRSQRVPRAAALARCTITGVYPIER